MAKTQEWLTGCPCCGTSDECDCDLSDFYAQLDKDRIEEVETQLAASQAGSKNKKCYALIGVSKKAWE